MLGHRHSHDVQEDLVYCPGPIELLYGAESPVKVADIAKHIAAARKYGRGIKHLSLLGCQFYEGTSKAFRTLGRKLRRVRNIEELAIDGVPGVGNDELASLARFLNANSTLRSLELTRATFDDAAIREVRPFLRRNSSLEVLVLGKNEFVGDEGVKTVVSALQAGPGRLRVLSAEACKVGREGVSSISDFMRFAGKSLRVLELSNNNIGDIGAKMLVESIKCGHCLVHLGLNNAEIGDCGALAFGELLQSNRSLRTLSLQSNARITNVGASAMIKSVYNTESIKAIVASNHVLDINLRGCSRINSNLLRLSSQLCGHSEIPSKDIIRMKISKHIAAIAEGGGRTVTLEDFDLELMPHLLAFVGKTTGVTSLFFTLKNTPLLYAQYCPEELQSQAPDEEEEEQTNRSIDENKENQSNMAPSQPCGQPDSSHLDSHPQSSLKSNLGDYLDSHLDAPRANPRHNQPLSQPTSHISNNRAGPFSINERSDCLFNKQCKPNATRGYGQSFPDKTSHITFEGGVFCLLFCLALKRRLRRLRSQNRLISSSTESNNSRDILS